MKLLPFLLLACGPEETSEKSTTPAVSGDEGLGYAVDAVGPFHAGYRTAERVYEPGGGASTRTIGLNLWYPTEDASGEKTFYTYGPPDSEAFLDASLAPSVYADGYPVVAFSHGAAADLCRYFASHGRVAMAPEHTGNTAADGAAPPSVDQYFERPLDIRESLDALEALAPSDPPCGRRRCARGPPRWSQLWRLHHLGRGGHHF